MMLIKLIRLFKGFTIIIDPVVIAKKEKKMEEVRVESHKNHLALIRKAYSIFAKNYTKTWMK